MDLGLLYGGGQVQGLQRAGVLIAARPGEGERHHRRLLPLRQEVQEGEPYSSVLKGDRNVTCEDTEVRIIRNLR